MASIAAVGGLVALLWTKSDRKLLRQQQLAFMAEHDEYMKQINARAKFELVLSVTDPGLLPDSREDELLATTARVGRRLLRVFALGIWNTGERRAGTTTVTVMVPKGVTALYWSNGSGEKVPVADDHPPVPADENLRLDGKEIETQAISLDLPRVTLHAHRALFFSCLMESNVNQMPIRVLAEADELPEADPVEVFDGTLKVYDAHDLSTLRGTVEGESPAF